MTRKPYNPSERFLITVVLSAIGIVAFFVILSIVASVLVSG